MKLGDSPVDWLDAAMAIWAIGLTLLVLAGMTWGLIYVKHVEDDLGELRERFSRYEERYDKDRDRREMMREQQHQLESLGRGSSN